MIWPPNCSKAVPLQARSGPKGSRKLRFPECKAVPLQARSGPEGSRKLRFPDFTTAQVAGKVVNLKHQLHLPPGNSPGTHFCQRPSRPQGHSAIGWMSTKNSNDTIWNRTSDLPIFVAQHLNHRVTTVPPH